LLNFDAPPCATKSRPDLTFSRLRDSTSDDYLEAFPAGKLERKCSLMEVDESPSLFNNHAANFPTSFDEEQLLRKQRNQALALANHQLNTIGHGHSG
jgi:hypothetical protein